ncbi:MAG: LacI family DNA-binding transcriptional regulator [Bacteroidales bacterium]|nr:LacI family DNA-binding transcriptional regulator [Bacteroidales bacterium]
MSKPAPLTIKDIARNLGVSVSTVSRALKDHPDISVETKSMIKAYAEQVNYRPNVLALSLRRQRSNTIGLIIPAIVHHFFSSVISGIEDLAYKEGYNLIICQSNENQHREAINLQTLVDHRVDGILVSLSKTTQEFDHFREAIDNGIPIVFYDRVTNEIESDQVITDDFEGGRIATNHLISRGCKNILHLAAPQHLLIGKDRRNGYCEALRSNNLEVREDRILKCDTREELLTLKNHLLNLAPEIDGIFAVNDSTAIAAIQVLQKHNYRVPEDIAVIGYGDGPNATIIHPELTTVVQKGYEMGRESIKLLLRRLNNPAVDINYQTKSFKPTLIVRQSA